jgi:hypothetical protein
MWRMEFLMEFNLHRADIVNDNISLFEIIAMWDVVKPRSR